MEWKGLWPYAQALEAQRAQRTGVVAGQRNEAVWLQEHPAVLTLGRRRVTGLPEAHFFTERGVSIVPTERGGLATFHGPGQLVGSLILDLRARGLGARRAVCGIEWGLIHWLASVGVQARRWDGRPGVWVEQRKIASIGLHIQRGVTLHGFALNVDMDLEPFGWFDPCGLPDVQMTSLKNEGISVGTCQELAFDVANAVLWSLYESSVDSSREGR
ncbi:MAG: lipoyl(octanoyl) transferase LipB [Myxococcota bacterium]